MEPRAKTLYQAAQLTTMRGERGVVTPRACAFRLFFIKSCPAWSN